MCNPFYLFLREKYDLQSFSICRLCHTIKKLSCIREVILRGKTPDKLYFHTKYVPLNYVVVIEISLPGDFRMGRIFSQSFCKGTHPSG